MLPAQPNQSLIDGLTCLQALAGRREAVGSRQLARELDLDVTRTNRLLKTLAHLGLAQQNEDRKYRPGPAIHVLAAQSLFGSGLIQRALPALQSLHRLKHVVAMGVLWRDKTCYLYHAHPGMTESQALGRVGLFPATQSGLGMALLAQQNDSSIQSLYKNEAIPGFSTSTKLLAELRRIRRVGYALVAVRERDRYTLAIPLDGGTNAAIGLSGQIKPNDVPKLLDAMRAAAAEIVTTEQD